MLEIPEIKKLSLKEYLEIPMNKRFYNYYHEVLKNEYPISDLDFHSFFSELYLDAVIFSNNYKELPYETNKYITDKYLKDELRKTNTGNGIVRSVYWYMLHELSELMMHETRTTEGGIVEIIEFNGQSFWTFTKTLFADFQDELKQGDEFGQLYFDLCDNVRMQVDAEQLLLLKRFVSQLTESTSKRIAPEKQADPITNRKQAKIKIDGQELNISERYLIANEMFDFDNVLQSLKVTSPEKHKLVSIVLGCSEHTGRQLINGAHQNRTPVREDIVNDYLKGLK